MNKRIMVIDDSRTICKILEVSLHREGYEVQSFHDGITALKYLAQPQACIPHLLFLDLSLPKIDGYEVLKHLKAKPQCQQIITVILSRRNGLIDLLKGRLAGARAYVTKPFKTEEVLALVQACIGPAHTCGEEARYVGGHLTWRGTTTRTHAVRKITLVADR